MYNLKKFNGTFKGNIGECMFKLTRKNLFLTRFHSKNKVINLFIKFLTKEQINFLNNNWYSIDALELISNKVVLFEVKTRNKYRKKLRFKPKATKSTVDLYTKAVDLGFIVNVVIV